MLLPHRLTARAPEVVTTDRISPGYPAAIVAMEHNIKGSAVGNQREALEVLDMAARGLVKTHLKVEKMDKLTEIFQQMSEGKMQGRVVLDLQ